MLRSALGFNGCVSAPHRQAALAGQAILDAGGTAVEAMVAAAATIAVVYPHMNGIGGDGFWLIKRKGEPPIGISGCGRAAGLATPDFYRAAGHDQAIPSRGGLAALTVPGTIDGWRLALEAAPGKKPLPLRDLLSSAIGYARDGMAVTANQSTCTRDKLATLQDVPGFADHFLVAGAPPAPGHRLKQQRLAQTLETLTRDGLASYYRGDIAERHATFLEQNGSPLRLSDFQRFEAERVIPLSVSISHGRLFNITPPTQGVASLMILAIFDRLGVTEAEGFAHLHGLIEATKQAFILRNTELGDPDRMRLAPEKWLDASRLDAMAAAVDPTRAMPWPYEPKEGDTVWMGAIDREGTVVSFIQSVFWEFGSGLTCADTGVFFQNRGAGFSLEEGPNKLGPYRRPFHTLNPALAALSDGRIMAYGTMGGEGQPQTQAAVFSRYVQFGQDLQQAVTAPRWLLGRTWGDVSTTLKLEDRFPVELIAALQSAGHDIEVLPAFSDHMGHAGAAVLHSSGLMEAASDPRADGAAIVF